MSAGKDLYAANRVKKLQKKKRLQKKMLHLPSEAVLLMYMQHRPWRGLWSTLQARSLDGLLEDGQTTVGISLNLKHTSATPVGCIVVCESELISIEGKKLCFQIDVKDDFGSIGSSVHERFIVDRQTFMQKAENKLSTNH